LGNFFKNPPFGCLFTNNTTKNGWKWKWRKKGHPTLFYCWHMQNLLISKAIRDREVHTLICLWWVRDEKWEMGVWDAKRMKILIPHLLPIDLLSFFIYTSHPKQHVSKYLGWSLNKVATLAML
jgi:hypothetical protein